ncbi:MAG: hypothetical protein ACYCU5_16030 [Actinomycetes bacterium]
MIAVDYDGTIADDQYPQAGTVDEDAVRVLKELKRHGHLLVLTTCREGEALEAAKERLAQHGLTFDAYNEQAPGYERFGRKLYYDLLIDDRAWPCQRIDWRKIEVEAAGGGAL